LLLLEETKTLFDMIGCAATIAAVAFVIGCIGSFFALEATLGERLMIASMTAGMTFLAAFVLFLRDRVSKVLSRRSVRRKILVRAEISESEFVHEAILSGVDEALMVQTRGAIARFFDVPMSKIYPMDNLSKVFAFDNLEPEFHNYVVFQILAERGLEDQSFWFNKN
jgi:hypothetical protein